MANIETLKISKHAQERYSERIMGRENKLEVNTYLLEHEDKIKEDITKMVEYGTLLYSGKPVSDIYERRNVDIYQNGLWIVIVDSGRNNVVTLYSIDLGCGDELNQMYIGKLLEQLEAAKQEVVETKAAIELEAEGYRDAIAQNEAIITDCRKTIKELEKCNESYRGVIEGLQTQVGAAERGVRGIVAKLIDKKIF